MSTPNKLPPLPNNNANLIRGIRGYMEAHPEIFDCDELAAIDAAIEALRQSQSLPAGAVAGLVGKWRDGTEDCHKEQGFARGVLFAFASCADQLEQSLQADAREKGVAWNEAIEAAAKEADHWLEIGKRNNPPARCVCGSYIAGAIRGLAKSSDKGCCRSKPCKHPGVGPCDMPATQPAQASEVVAPKFVSCTCHDERQKQLCLNKHRCVRAYPLATSSQETASE